MEPVIIPAVQVKAWMRRVGASFRQRDDRGREVYRNGAGVLFLVRVVGQVAEIRTMRASCAC